MKFAIIGFVVATATWIGTNHSDHISTHVRTAASSQDDHWNWHGRIAASHAIEIHNINGDITAEPSTGAEVEVSAVKHAGHRGDIEDVSIRVAQQEGNVTICVIYPNSNTDENCEEHRGSHSGNNRNDTQVDFTVRVPRGVELVANAVNGDVEAMGMSGDVTAESVNGSVRLETTGGEATGSSVNGSVTATLHALGQRSLKFSSVNGAVNVTLPAGINADVDAQTVNGSIDTDFPVSVRGRMSPRHISGTIGSGGRRLDLETVNGSIRLRKLP
jgi:DUF4097 and DUF4098 domain-containing protein YvlB